MGKHRDLLEETLVRCYGHTSFRPGQRELMELVLSGQNALGLLATGGGKSLTYQLPSLLLPHLTVVVTPLISLMIDQVQKLRQQGRRDVTYLNSALRPDEIRQQLQELRAGRYKLLYISPEKLQHPAVTAMLQERGVSLFAIDEAHCISQWGHDFRTDYLRLPAIVEALGSPPVLAVTATATAAVAAEICELFQIPPHHLVKQSLNRSNITYDVYRVQAEQEKLERLLSLLAVLDGAGIVYCSTRQAVEQVVRRCREAGMHDVHGYHGGMDAIERVLIQEQFLRNKLRVIIATNAFGMGIDKPDIRFVLHYQFPASLEAYVQEVGRIGRDGEPGYAGLFYWPEDGLIHQRLQERESLADDQLKQFLALVQAGKTPGGAAGRLAAAELPAGIAENQLRALFFYAERAGVLADVLPTKDGYQFRVCSAASADALRQIAAELARIQRVKQEKLAAIVSWLRQGGCLRRQLSAYFGEREEADAPALGCCSACGFDRSRFWRRKQAERQESGEKWQLERALARLLGQKPLPQTGGQP
ncbi:RecQ family ATP-dependent DNA helicase [Brevibacillus marinus]|uniref:RecQ family ATP-dependent DNA helicase n=1 Tax=Brevibacillus marinus TaxID=2496837 RepID=UPI000F82F7D6|nr:RecQ family ATP-dependent DNA helicase [Brevibacillus marinus]